MKHKNNFGINFNKLKNDFVSFLINLPNLLYILTNYCFILLYFSSLSQKYHHYFNH